MKQHYLRLLKLTAPDCGSTAQRTSAARMQHAFELKYPNFEILEGVFSGGTNRIKVRCTTHDIVIKSFTYNEYVLGDRVPCKECVGAAVVMARLAETAASLAAFRAKYPALDFDNAEINSVTKRDSVVYCTAHEPEIPRTFSYHHNVIADKSICAGCKGAYDARVWVKEHSDLITAYTAKYPNLRINDVAFPNKTAPTTIWCDVCGDNVGGFTIQKIARMRHGCAVCSKTETATIRTKSTTQFIAEAREVHGNVYDYSKTNYVSAHTHVVITCVVHGDFMQTPSSHTNTKTGCPKCGNNAVSEKLRNSTEYFIARAREVHGDLYDYNAVEYGANGRDKVIIGCPQGHQFEQSPEDHLAGKGCIRCAGVVRYTTEEFIAAAREVHGNLYDYALVDYQANNKPVKILCANHGVFKQSYISHVLNRCGCQVCSPATSAPERTIYEEIYRWGLKFRFQKRFPDCRHVGLLAFDFYIPIPNKPGIIVEYDGIQHTQAIDAWGGEEGLIKRQTCDRIKDEYCAEKEITMIRIAHNDNLDEALINIRRLCREEGLFNE